MLLLIGLGQAVCLALITTVEDNMQPDMLSHQHKSKMDCAHSQDLKKHMYNLREKVEGIRCLLGTCSNLIAIFHVFHDISEHYCEAYTIESVYTSHT